MKRAKSRFSGSDTVNVAAPLIDVTDPDGPTTGRNTTYNSNSSNRVGSTGFVKW
jgi:hypothetical protein